MAESRGQIKWGWATGSLGSVLPMALCLGTLAAACSTDLKGSWCGWPKPVVRLLQKFRWETDLLVPQCGWWGWELTRVLFEICNLSPPGNIHCGRIFVKLRITLILENLLYFIPFNSNWDLVQLPCNTHCLFSNQAPSEWFLFSEKSGRLIFAMLLWEGAEVEVGDPGERCSYLMVCSKYAPFRLPAAPVLITSKHDGLVQPVEFVEYLQSGIS